MRELVLFLLLFLSAAPTEALTVHTPTGIDSSSFSYSVDSIAKTITITETITNEDSSFLITFECGAGGCGVDVGDFSVPGWDVTLNITNGTSTAWATFQVELRVPSVTPSGDYTASSDSDGVAFKQGVPGRVIDSTAFGSQTVDEFDLLDFIQFFDGPIQVGGTDTQQIPVTNTNTSESAFTTIQYFQHTPPTDPSCYEVSTTTYNFEDISTTGTEIDNDNDDPGCPRLSGNTGTDFFLFAECHGGALTQVTSFMNMPFPFYDIQNVGFGYGDDGFFSFNEINNLANAATLIVPWNTELRFNVDGNGSDATYYQTLGTSPNRYFIVQWNNGCLNATCSATPVTFQIKLFETSKVIEMHFKDVNGTLAADSSRFFIKDRLGATSCTTDADPPGCEFQCNTMASIYRCGRQLRYTNSLSDEQAIRFSPIGCGQNAWGWTHRP